MFNLLNLTEKKSRCDRLALFGVTKRREPTNGFYMVMLSLLLSFPAAGQPLATSGKDDLSEFLQDKELAQKMGTQVQVATKIVTDAASDLVITALSFLGVHYKRGGNSVDSGLDCSGFVRLVYEQTLGMLLPRRSAEQATFTIPIETDDLQPGDLVFFNTLKAKFSHVGIYLGNHQFIHAPRSGAVVRVEDMRVGYWQRRFDGARRVEVQKIQSKN
jgi:cell wall-associated NlpC family hydrolase